MKLATITALYTALSFESCFGHITDRETEHCKGKSNLSVKEEICEGKTKIMKMQKALDQYLRECLRNCLSIRQSTICLCFSIFVLLQFLHLWSINWCRQRIRIACRNKQAMFFPFHVLLTLVSIWRRKHLNEASVQLYVCVCV